MTRAADGAAAETLAAAYLERRGLRVLERNYRCRMGEIDLILADGASLVFAEVRYRSSAAFGGAAASVTRAKQRKLVAAAGHYLAGSRSARAASTSSFSTGSRPTRSNGSAMRSPLRRFAAGLTLALAAGLACAQPVRLVVQSSPLAGFRYHDAPAVFAEIKPGDALALVREPGNPHDPNAVRVEWQGRMLGYVPRAENGAVAWALDRGEPLRARVSKVREHPNPRMRVEFEVYIE